MAGGSNAKLNRARERADNEFYTLHKDVDEELDPFGERGDFRGKTLYFPCDGEHSAFWEWGVDSFKRFGFRHIVATSYNPTGQGVRLDYDGERIHKVDLDGNGDFRSEECSRIRDASDVILTNPPFSLWREFLLWAECKPFAIVATLSAWQYRHTYEGFAATPPRWHSGHARPRRFIRPDGTLSDALNGIGRWLVSLPRLSPPARLPLSRYNPETAQFLDRNGALNCSKLKDIPGDFRGLIGVPPTFLDNPDPRFRIVKMDNWPSIHGEKLYTRILIRRIPRFRHLRKRRRKAQKRHH